MKVIIAFIIGLLLPLAGNQVYQEVGQSEQLGAFGDPFISLQLSSTTPTSGNVLYTNGTDNYWASASAGSFPSYLSQIGDVSTTSLATNDVLYYTGSGWAVTATSSWTHDQVTLTGTPDYITISGQVITRGTVDIGDDTNLVGGANITLTGDTLDLDAALASMTSFSHASGGIMTVSNTDTNGHIAFTSGQTLNSSSGTDKFFSIAGTINNSGTAATDFLQLDMTTTAAGSGAQYALNILNDSSSVFAIGVDGGISYGATQDFSGATVTGMQYYPAFTYATTTWTGTTTIPLGPAYNAQTWAGVKCYTDTGTVNVSFHDGTNHMDLLNASTTVGTVGLTTNNSFTASEKRYVDLGTPASTPTEVSCSVSYQDD